MLQSNFRSCVTNFSLLGFKSIPVFSNVSFTAPCLAVLLQRPRDNGYGPKSRNPKSRQAKIPTSKIPKSKIPTGLKSRQVQNPDRSKSRNPKSRQVQNPDRSKS